MKDQNAKQSKKFQTFLKQVRQQTGLSQGEVAQKLGYNSPQFISNWERGLSHPPMFQIISLAELYRVSAEEIYNLMVEDALARTEQKMHDEFMHHKRQRSEASL